MVDSLQATMRVASAGLAAQSARIKIAAENLANANSTGQGVGATPYTRKTISFASEVDDRLAAQVVKVDAIGLDNREFPLVYEPGHPAADARGYVKRPNVDPFIELSDMREANRSYLANLQVLRSVREAAMLTIDLLKGG